MIPKALRLPIGQTERKSGEATPSPSFLLKSWENKLSHHRFGVIIGGKVHKSAVFRHRVKRIILTSVASWPIWEGRAKDFLFIISPRLGKVPKRELRDILTRDLAALRGIVGVITPRS